MVAGSEKNLILGGLPEATRRALESVMTVHSGALGDTLQPENRRIDAVWFPLSGLVSTVRTLEGNTQVEVDASGFEGFLGIELLLGSSESVDCWMVQSPGRFARLDAGTFTDAVSRDAALRTAATRYAAAVVATRGQWVACNARHTVEQRLAKWLLLTSDRVGAEIAITQDMVAMMLGVRRASVVTALGRFVDDGFVQHGYGRVKLLDDGKLQEHACCCYARANGLLFGNKPGDAVSQAGKLG